MDWQFESQSPSIVSSLCRPRHGQQWRRSIHEDFFIRSREQVVSDFVGSRAEGGWRTDLFILMGRIWRRNFCPILFLWVSSDVMPSFVAWRAWIQKKFFFRRKAFNEPKVEWTNQRSPVVSRIQNFSCSSFCRILFSSRQNDLCSSRDSWQLVHHVTVVLTLFSHHVVVSNYTFVTSCLSRIER